MKVRVFAAVFLSLAITGTLCAQDATSAPSSSQDNGSGRGPGGGFGRGGMGMGMAGNRGTMGTVTEVAADHFAIKTEAGEIYTVHFSANTRIMKQPASSSEGRGQGRGWGGPPEQIKASDIKVGDAIGAMGEVDASAKSVGAVAIVVMDPERARQMAEMQANYGKTWLMGKVTAIDGVKITVLGSVDNASHTFVADENTTFRERREPVTLADIQVGNVVRAEGAMKDGAFTATTVNVMRMPQGGPRIPRSAPQQ